MTVNTVNIDASLEQMFQRMGDLLKDIAASRTGMSEELAETREFAKNTTMPGLGENFDLSA